MHGSFNDFISSVSIHGASLEGFLHYKFQRATSGMRLGKGGGGGEEIQRKGGPKTLLRERDYPRSFSSGCASISLGACTACTTYQHVL